MGDDLADGLASGARPPWWRPGRVALAAGLAVLAAPLVWAYLAHIDWPARPSPLPREIAEAAGGRPGLTGTSYVYDFWGNFIDAEHLWRVEVGPEVVAALVRDCGAQELGPAAEVPAAFWRQPPCWWRPKPGGAARFFMSPRFDPRGRGLDGNHYLLMYDEREGVLYGWVKYNF